MDIGCAEMAGSFGSGEIGSRWWLVCGGWLVGLLDVETVAV